MKVEPSGVVFSATCDVQTERCVAREWGRSPPSGGRRERPRSMYAGHVSIQKVRTGAWEIEGARLRQRVGATQ